MIWVEEEGGRTFSSPMVNLPCVCLLAIVKSLRRLVASFCITVSPNLMLPFVYS